MDQQSQALIVKESTNIEQLEFYAKHFAQSGYFRDAKDLSKAVVKIQAGRELGIPPVAAMRGIDVFDGQISLRGHLMAGIIKASGRYRYKILESTALICRISFSERVDGKWEELGEASFTADDARQANLTGKDNWKKHPQDMLYNRTMGRGGRMYCADLFYGAAYVEGEIESTVVVDTEESPVDTEEHLKQSRWKLHAMMSQWPEVRERFRNFLVSKNLTSTTELSQEQLDLCIATVERQGERAFIFADDYGNTGETVNTETGDGVEPEDIPDPEPPAIYIGDEPADLLPARDKPPVDNFFSAIWEEALCGGGGGPATARRKILLQAVTKKEAIHSSKDLDDIHIKWNELEPLFDHMILKTRKGEFDEYSKDEKAMREAMDAEITTWWLQRKPEGVEA